MRREQRWYPRRVRTQRISSNVPVCSREFWVSNEFLQRKCFDAPLQSQEVEGIKEMVKEHAEGGVRDDGLTEAGFLYLHTIFIQRGRLETTWTVLRKFGYAEDLHLTESFLLPKWVFCCIRTKLKF